MDGLLEKKLNELCWVINVVEENSEDEKTQGLELHGVDEVVRTREIKITNRLFPDLSWRNKPEEKEVVLKYRVLVCRIKYVCTYRNATDRTRGVWTEKTLYRIRREECDRDCAVDDEILRQSWRGSTEKGGMCHGMDPAEKLHMEKEARLNRGQNLPPRLLPGWCASNPLTLDEVLPSTTQWREPVAASTDTHTVEKTQQRYTLCDAFCGAGGTSRGAMKAGLRVELGFDHWDVACRTWLKNFPTAVNYELDVNAFVSLKGVEHKVDILHLSPPCQFFSQAHTTRGKNDEVNIDAQFVITDLLKKTRPRVATMEQTAGLPRRHQDYLHAILQMFTAIGFSVRWRVLKCSDFGLAQNRMRLFVIASWYVTYCAAL